MVVKFCCELADCSNDVCPLNVVAWPNKIAEIFFTVSSYISSEKNSISMQMICQQFRAHFSHFLYFSLCVCSIAICMEIKANAFAYFCTITERLSCTLISMKQWKPLHDDDVFLCHHHQQDFFLALVYYNTAIRSWCVNFRLVRMIFFCAFT